MNDDVAGLFHSLDQLPVVEGIRPSATALEPVVPGRLYRFWRDAWGMDVEEQPHIELAGIVDNALGDRMFRGDQKTLLGIGVPRGSFKTTGISEATTVEILSINPDAKILLDGFRHSVAKARLRAVRRKIEQDEKLDELYGTKAWKPEFRSDTWNDEEIIITPRRDTMSREASVATAGVDRSMNSQHFDVIIADDLVTDTNVQTADARERVYQHILDLMPILNPGGVLILVFTTWHPDDAYMRLMRLDQERVRRGDRPMFTWYIKGAYDGPTGLYFPKRLTHAFLEEQREILGSRKFSAQYLLKPMSDEDKTFNMDALRLRPFNFFSTHERMLGGVIRLGDTKAQMDVETTIAWDPAGRKPSRTSDSHGITVVGTDSDDRWWLAEAMGVKAPPTVIIDRMCRLIQLYRPWTVSIEDALGSGLWLDMLADECVRRSISCQFTEFSTGGVPKNERIVLLQPRWERGLIVTRATDGGTPMHPAFLRQVDQFAVGATLDHEDILDSLVQHLRLTRKPTQQAVVLRDPNPPDQEYAAFRTRKDEETGGSGKQTGLYGGAWTV